MNAASLLVGCLGAAACFAGACRTERVDTPAGLALAQPISLATQRAWRVVAGGKACGFVVRFAAAEAPDDASRHFYSVRNELQQELGCIDGLGRAWRYEIHAREPAFVGTGSVAQGVRAILSLDATAELREIAIGENAAAPRRN